MNYDGTGFTKLLDFDGTNGARAYAGLTPYSGVLYGASYQGGSNDLGTIFKINHDGSGFTKLIDLNQIGRAHV